jgi:hypothetical protein
MNQPPWEAVGNRPSLYALKEGQSDASFSVLDGLESKRVNLPVRRGIAVGELILVVVFAAASGWFLAARVSLVPPPGPPSVRPLVERPPEAVARTASAEMPIEEPPVATMVNAPGETDILLHAVAPDPSVHPVPMVAAAPHAAALNKGGAARATAARPLQHRARRPVDTTEAIRKPAADRDVDLIEALLSHVSKQDGAGRPGQQNRQRTPSESQ